MFTDRLCAQQSVRHALWQMRELDQFIQQPLQAVLILKLRLAGRLMGPGPLVWQTNEAHSLTTVSNCVSKNLQIWQKRIISDYFSSFDVECESITSFSYVLSIKNVDNVHMT